MPEFEKLGSYFKTELAQLFKHLQEKYAYASLGIEAFFESVEVLVRKIYKDNVDEEGNFSLEENLESFLDTTIEFFEEFVANQDEKK